MELLDRGDCIFHVKELLSPELCHRLIDLYAADPRKHAGYTAGAGGDRQLEVSVKVSTDLDIDNEGHWAPAYEQLHAAVSHAVLSIAALFPSLQVWPLRCTGYKLQHYKKDEGYFRWHFDALGPGAWDRQLAVIVYLNSVEVGGETCFHRQNLRIKPVAGDALFFPTFWTHLHCGEIAKSEDKYVVSSFVNFAIAGAHDDQS